MFRYAGPVGPAEGWVDSGVSADQDFQLKEQAVFAGLVVGYLVQSCLSILYIAIDHLRYISINLHLKVHSLTPAMFQFPSL